jgi:hypothetical protein
LTHFPRFSSLQKQPTPLPTFSSPHHLPLSQSIPNNHGCGIQPTFPLLTASQPLKYKHQPPNTRAPDVPPSPQRSGRPSRDPSHLVHRRPFRTYHALNPLPILISSLPPKPKEHFPAKEQIEYASPAIPTTSVQANNTGWDETTEGPHKR